MKGLLDISIICFSVSCGESVSSLHIFCRFMIRIFIVVQDNRSSSVQTEDKRKTSIPKNDPSYSEDRRNKKQKRHIKDDKMQNLKRKKW